MNQIKTVRGQVLVQEGELNEYAYIILNGEFRGYKKFIQKGQVDQNRLDESFNEVLSGFGAKKSVKGIFSQKI